VRVCLFSEVGFNLIILCPNYYVSEVVCMYDACEAENINWLLMNNPRSFFEFDEVLVILC